MITLFQTKKLFLKLFENEIELIDLDNNKTINRKSNQIFSKKGLLIAEFSIAEKELKNCVDYLVEKKIFTPSFEIIVQPKIEKGDWLSEVEKRAILEICERVGAKKVLINDSKNELTISKARSLLTMTTLNNLYD